MNLKKSIFSYIIWAVFAVFCCLSLSAALERAGIVKLLGLSQGAVIVGVCVYLFCTAAVFAALRIICMEIAGHISNKKKLEDALSRILPVLVLLGAAAYLTLYLAYAQPLVLINDSFYRQAFVADRQSVSFTFHGASWLYICLLHLMLLLFGNTPFAGVVLQVMLFFVCLLLLYIGMQAYAGAFPAAVSMAAFGFLPITLQYIFFLTPELFSLALYLVGFCLTGAAYRKFQQSGIASLFQYIGIFLLGLYLGFVVYLDIYGVSLYFLLAALWALEQEKRKQAAAVLLFAILGGICGFFLSVSAACRIGELPVSSYLQKFFALYFEKASFSAAFPDCLPDTGLLGSMLLISFAFFLVPAFFVWKKSLSGAFILNLLFLYGLSVFSVAVLNMQINTTFAYSILAGLGAYSVLWQPKEAALEKKKEAQMEKIKETDAAQPVEKEKEQEKPAPGAPLQNPLPVPKKKSRPALDFGYEIKEADMKFDIEITDEDDFDC